MIINSEALTVIIDGVVKEELDLNVTIREVIELLFKFAKMRDEGNFKRWLYVINSKTEVLLLYVFKF